MLVDDAKDNMRQNAVLMGDASSQTSAIVRCNWSAVSREREA
jgi:hypothetical protein